MLKLFLYSYLLIVQTYFFLICWGKFTATTFSYLCFLLFVLLCWSLSLSLTHVFVEHCKKIIWLLFLNQIRAALRKIKSIVILIAILKPILWATLITSEYFTLFKRFCLKCLDNCSCKHDPFANIIMRKAI